MAGSVQSEAREPAGRQGDGRPRRSGQTPGRTQRAGQIPGRTQGAGQISKRTQSTGRPSSGSGHSGDARQGRRSRQQSRNRVPGPVNRQQSRDGVQGQRNRQQSRNGAPGPENRQQPRNRGQEQRSREHYREETGAPVKKKPRRFYDYSLVFCIIFLTAFGLVMIYSASSYTAQLKFQDAAFFMKRQAAIASVGFAGMIIVSKTNYRIYRRFAVLGLFTAYLLMVLVSIIGNDANGKKRWLQIGPVSFQPTEVAKIAVILFLAVTIAALGQGINKWKNVRKLLILTVPIGAIVAMNNLSSGIIVCGIIFVMLFVACKVKWPFFTLAGLGGFVLAFAGPIGKVLLQIHILQPYQYRRIEAWLNPESDPEGKGFQVLQGLYAIGSGGMVGQGLGGSIQKLGFLPESQNDMIFAIICEELGLFGAVSIIMIYLFIIYRLMVIANNAPDLEGALLVVGIMGQIAIQVILNIAVVTNTIPNTGITLPFISYGGTSVLFLLLEMGLVLSVSNQIKLEK